MRRSNTAGPCVAHLHTLLPALERLPGSRIWWRPRGGPSRRCGPAVSRPSAPARCRLALLTLALAAGCPQAEPLPPRGDCNPVDDGACLLPFPSSFFLDEDPASATGWRVAFGPRSLPVNDWGAPLDPTAWNRRDGFSTLGPLFALLPGASVEGLIGHRDLGAHLDPDARTVILDAQSGARVPHFCELDVAAEDPARRLLVLRPVVPLEHARRYVVGLRGVVDGGGQPVPAPAGFAALRDRLADDDPDLDRQRAHYDAAIFPALERAGFDREDLVLAWDFVTVSAEGSLEDPLRIRADALARLPPEGPPYVVTGVEEGACDGADPVGRTLTGTFTAPLYLTNPEPGSLLFRDAQGRAGWNGEVEVPFTVRVPCTLLAEPRRAALIQYGHGVLGSQDEVRTAYLGEVAERYGWVLFAVDWTGMKEDDFVAIASAVANDFSGFVTVPERLFQGQVEQLAAARLMLGGMAHDDHLIVGGIPLLEGSELSYWGNSQGAILGGGYVALSPDLRRAVLGVGGTPFSLVLPRAVGFDAFFLTMQHTYEDPADIALLVGLAQMLWDPAESAGWARFVTGTTVDADTPPKDVLIHAAIGDAGVTTLAAHVMARAFGASLLDPPARDVWGLEARTAPFEGSALVEFDYGVEEPVEAVACDAKTDTHELPRRQEEAWEQIRAFLEDGEVLQTCDGACDPD